MHCKHLFEQSKARKFMCYSFLSHMTCLMFRVQITLTGDVNNVNNYETMMVVSLMAKLFGSINPHHAHVGLW